LNPITGFKRLFSKKLLFESFKSIVKIAIFGAVIYFAVVSFLPTLMGLIDTDPQVYPKLLIDEGRELAYKLILALLIIALLDLVYTRWDYAQQMRMSHRDVKEEVKRREGDPQIRSKRRQLQKEAVERAGSIRKVPDADVLITNPTHLAIAIKYQRHTMIAPEVIAKGAGELAAAMKKVAKRHNVVTVENKKLARALFKKSDVDGLVPEALYPETAKILAWVFMQQQMMSANTNKRNFD
jgi:flagellar biosynthetic protein FlhB